MALFTVILEYRRGTYITQVAAKGPRQALTRWAEDLSPKIVARLSARAKAALPRLAAERDGRLNEPTPIAGLPNVWCAGFPFPGGLVNIIRTHSGRGAVEQ
jgi:hypothetical protein